jgi:hypothetical protein
MLPDKYMKCPYNPNHVKFLEEMPLHMEICPDMMFFGRTKAGRFCRFNYLSEQ